MITLEEIDRRGYEFVFGDRSFVENAPNQTIKLFAAHVHTSYSDGIHAPEQVIYAAASLGIDAITLTDHDTNEGNLEFAELIKSYGLDNYQGVEYTSFVELPSGLLQPAHLIAQKNEKGIETPLIVPKKVLPPEEVIVEMHNQNASVTGPHPNHHHDSLTTPVIIKIQSNSEQRNRLDFLEVDNGAIRQLEHVADVLGPLGWIMRKMDKIPAVGGNEEARIIYEHLKDRRNTLHPVNAIAGSDSHRAGDVGKTVVGYLGDNPIKAAKSGDIIILAQKPTMYSFREYLQFHRRAKRVDNNWHNRMTRQTAQGRAMLSAA